MSMNKNFYIGAAALLLMSQAAFGQIGEPYIHDPSTIVECGGTYYTFGTGGGGLMSSDGWTWNGGAVRPGGGAAPDAMKIGNRYLIVYGTSGGGLGGGHSGRIMTMWNKTLDPKSPDFKFSDPVEVTNSTVNEDCDAIDPGLLMGPDGRLWLSYGTYFGFIRLVELDPKTGARVKGNVPVNIAIDCEATDMIYHDGWYYLLGTHGTCCDGMNSTYNIVVGRSRKVTGPFLDNVGRDMIQGGGKMVLAADDRYMGAGHFGRFVVENGVEKMSCHFEADQVLGGRSVLAIRPLLWKDGWPVAGEILSDGTYEIESVRRGYALELAVDFVRLDSGMRFFRRDQNEPVTPVKTQSLSDVVSAWPAGNIEVRISDYMSRPHQKWEVTAVPDGGGYLGGSYYKIVIAGTKRALAATADAELTTVPEFTGAPEQLWKIEQLTDGTFRIVPKSAPKYALTSIADSTPSLVKFDMNSVNCKWNFKARK